MTYASHTRRPNPAALLGALGIPAAVGAVMVVGLAVKVVIAPDPPPLKSVTFRPTPIPPPPPTDPVEPTTSTRTPQTNTATTTIPRVDNPLVNLGSSEPIDTLPRLGTDIGPVDFGIPDPKPPVSPFEPVGATPRGKPGTWVTNNDYRPRWIREELTGSARFTLSIDTVGKVTGCTITRSTGHAALDAATCELVTKRAHFDAARDGNGKAVAGSFSSTITWKIPD